MNHLIDRFLNLSIWAQIAIGLFTALCIYSAYSARTEDYPFIAFFEIFLANVLANGYQPISIFIGYVAGKKVSEKSHKNWLGWIVGILIFVIVATAISFSASRIPGAGWRYNAICEESPYC